MDSWNKALQQLVDVFRSMTVGAQITAALLLAIVVISLVFLFRLQTGSGASEHLFGDRPLSSSELNRIEGAFASASLDGWERSGSYIKVPRNQKAAYLAALVENNALPASFGSYFADALAQDSPFGSREQNAARREAALEREFSFIFSQMQAIDEATVMIDEEIQRGFLRDKVKTAVVSVRPAANAVLTKDLVRSIQLTMAGMVAGLSAKDVTVMDLSSNIAHTGIEEDAPGASGRLFAEVKSQVEADYKAKINEVVKVIPGAIVAVEATLDTTLDEATQTVKYDPKAVAVELLDVSKTETSTTAQRGGRPGAAPNGVGNSQQVVSASPQQQRQINETTTDQSSRVGHTQVASVKSGLAVQRVASTVRIPKSYYAQVWRQEWGRKNPDAKPEDAPKGPTEAELQEVETRVNKGVQDSVAGLLPLATANDATAPLVTVTSYQDLPAAVSAEPSATQTAMSWLSANWQTLAMGVVALVSLMMLRTMVRAPLPGPDREAAGKAPELRVANVEEDEEDEGSSAKQGLRRRQGADAPSLKVQLAEMVKEDPDAAASVLKSWIGDAA